MMIEVEFFENVANRTKHSKQPLERLIKWAQTNEVLKLKTLKYRLDLQTYPELTKAEKSDKKVRSFPALTFAGTFSGTGKAADINKISGLIVLDLDHLQKVEEVYKLLAGDPLTYCLFISPSADGLKMVVRHDLTGPDEWEYLYLELENHLQCTYGLPTDPSGKDINRMCFIPFMNKVHINEDSKIWHYSGKPEQTQTKPREIQSTDPDPQSNDLYAECFYISAFLFENKIDITDSYYEWITYGYSLCALGAKGREIFHNISCISSKYSYDECESKYDYLESNYDETQTGISYYLSNAKKAIADYTLYSKYGIKF